MPDIFVDKEGGINTDKFFKHTGMYIIILIILAVIAAFAVGGWYTVSEQENAVLTTAGRVTDVRGAGLHFKIPFLQRAYKVDMTTRGMTIGYIEQNGQTISTGDNFMISNDFNIVSIDFYAEWRVTTPEKFLFKVEAPLSLLENIIQSSARDVVSAYGIDSILTDGKTEIQSNIRELVSVVLDSYDIGITVSNITIQDAEPPTVAVTEAFKAVEDAKQKKDTMINEANRYYNEHIPAARAEADGIIKSAEAFKEARINEANGQVARFNKMFEEYRNFPEITRMRMYLETIEEVMPSLHVIIDGQEESSLFKMMDIGR